MSGPSTSLLSVFRLSMAFAELLIMGLRPLCLPLVQTSQCSSMTWRSSPWLPTCTIPRRRQRMYKYYLPALYKIHQQLRKPLTRLKADKHPRITSNNTQTWQVLPPRKATPAPKPLEGIRCHWPRHQVGPNKAILPLLHCHQTVRGIRHSLHMGILRQCRRCLRRILVQDRD